VILKTYFMLMLMWVLVGVMVGLGPLMYNPIILGLNKVMKRVMKGIMMRVVKIVVMMIVKMMWTTLKLVMMVGL